MTARTLTVDSAPDRMRLDVFLAAKLGAEFSRSQAARMIRAGLVRLNGAFARAADAVHAGDKVEINTPSVAPTAIISFGHCAAPEIEVLYADDEIVVVNKPAGMTVHPAPGHPGGTLVDALLARFPDMTAMAEPDGVMRPGIVHRLDKDTSGVMVVARTPFARMELARQFKQRSVRKIYLAVVRGLVGRERFSVARPIGRHPVERKRMSVNSRHGREALSEVCVLARMPMAGADTTLMGVRPLTGRTHQIRVHLASIGHPCLGDPLYGGRQGKSSQPRNLCAKNSQTKPVAAMTVAAMTVAAMTVAATTDDASSLFGHQALHALALRLSHPRTAAALEFVASLPQDLVRFLAARRIATGRAELQRWIEVTSRPLGERPVKIDSPTVKVDSPRG